jgi:hypothetical protein
MDTQTKDQNQDSNEKQNQTSVTTQTTTEVLPKGSIKKKENIKYEIVVCDKTDGSETSHPLEEDKELIIGADPTCSISIDDEYLSFKHFSVRLKKNKVKVKDLSSKNGLFLSIGNLMRILPGQTLFAGKKFFKIREIKSEQ